jgi:hypothetical protein
MPNRFTRVPEGPVPALPLAGRALLPLADAFMLAMLSRPASGSLRTTWVTPATLALCLGVLVVGAPLGAVSLATGLGDAHWLRVAAGLVIILLAAGSAAVAAVGVLQRR